MRVLYLLLAVASAIQSQDAIRPVARVVKLLTDMRNQVESEGEADKELNDKMVCWCKNNGADKKQAIATGATVQSRLKGEIEEQTALSSSLAGGIAKAKSELAANQKALDEAQEVRDKELKVFNQEDQDSMAAINGLKDAIRVLSKNNFMQSELKRALANVPISDKILGAVAPQARHVFGLLEQPMGAKSYNSQSGAIQGILKEMKARFEDQHASAKKDEGEKSTAHSQLRAAKTAEIEAGYKMAESKTQEKADADISNANAKNDLKDTSAALAADREFLADLTAKCARTEEEYAARTKTRTAEMGAINDTIDILNSDEAHAGFEKTTNTEGTAATSLEFLQMGSSHRSMRSKVVAALEKAANVNDRTKIVALAMSAQLDAFTKVKAAIDQMIEDLAKENKDEINHKDFCVKSFNENDSDMAETQQAQDKCAARIAELTETINKLDGELENLAADLKNTKEQMRRAGDDRARANAEFQTVVNDSRATQAVLDKAYQRMKMFYDPEVQLEGTPTTPAPEVVAAVQQPRGFDDMKKNAGGNKVLGMLKKIMDETKEAEDEAITDEKEQQRAYEAFTKDSNDDVKAWNESTADKTAARARAEGEKIEKEAESKANLNELDLLNAEAQNLHKSCDFTIKNFDMRQAARAQESEALREAKNILSGSQ